MIYIDKYGHMVADTLNELHNFAFNLIGLKRHFFQGTRKGHPHYDLTTEQKLNKAIENGAKIVGIREIVTLSREMIDYG